MEKLVSLAQQESIKNGRNRYVERIEQAVADSKNAKMIYLFSTCVDTADTKKLLSALIETKDYKYLTLFAQYVPDVDVKLIEDVIVQSGNVEAVVYFAKTIENEKVDINRLERTVINSGYPKSLWDFASNVRQADIGAIEVALINTHNAKYIYMSALDVLSFDVNRLALAIIETGDIKYIYKYLVKLGADCNYEIRQLLKAKIKEFKTENTYLAMKLKIKETDPEVEQLC